MSADLPRATEPALYYSRLADDDDLAELIGLFVAELPERLARMAAAADRQDWALVGSLAHQLKGAGGSHGFDPLTPLSYQVERAARTGQPAEEIRAAFDALKEGCSRARAGKKPS